ncbi:hypothetical protein Hanom_Chr04g00291201 [Helianthus anomalus]
MKMKREEKPVYFPGALPQRSPILSLVEVRFSQSTDFRRVWTDVCGGSCRIAMVISGEGVNECVFNFAFEVIRTQNVGMFGIC